MAQLRAEVALQLNILDEDDFELRDMPFGLAASNELYNDDVPPGEVHVVITVEAEAADSAGKAEGYSDVLDHKAAFLEPLDPMRSKRVSEGEASQRATQRSLQIMHAYMKIFPDEARQVLAEPKELKHTECPAQWRESATMQFEPDFTPQICQLETGGGGDCFFYSLAYVYTLWHRSRGGTETFTMTDARQWFAECINEHNAKQVHKMYCESQHRSTQTLFKRLNRDSQTLVQDIQDLVRRDASWKTSMVWGDSETLRLLMSEHRRFKKIGIMAILDSGDLHAFTSGYLAKDHYLLLFNQVPQHWRVAGVRNDQGKVVPFFSRFNVPSVIKAMFLRQKHTLMYTEKTVVDVNVSRNVVAVLRLKYAGGLTPNDSVWAKFSPQVINEADEQLNQLGYH